MSSLAKGWNSSFIRGHILILSIFLKLALLCGATKALAAEESLSTEELRELQNQLKQRQSLTVKFTQTRTSSLRPKKPSVSSGQAVFAKPAKFRWEFEKPAADVLLFDGRALISFKPGEKTATRFSSKAERAREIKEVIDFVLDFDALLERYSIKQATRSKSEIKLSLSPKSTGAITDLMIDIDAKSYFVTTIKITFQNRNTSEFKFMEPRTDAVSKDSFSVPPGVKIIDGV